MCTKWCSSSSSKMINSCPRQKSRNVGRPEHRTTHVGYSRASHFKSTKGGFHSAGGTPSSLDGLSHGKPESKIRMRTLGLPPWRNGKPQLVSCSWNGPCKNNVWYPVMMKLWGYRHDETETSTSTTTAIRTDTRRRPISMDTRRCSSQRARATWTL